MGGSGLREHTGHSLQQCRAAEGLGEGGFRAQLPGNLQVVVRAETSTARQGDDAQAGLLAVQVHDNFDAFLFRHNDVREDQVERSLSGEFHALENIGGRDSFVAGVLPQELAHEYAHRRFVIDD